MLTATGEPQARPAADFCLKSKGKHMIHHISIAAHDPKGVAQFFADVTGGVSVDFPPNPGSYMAFAPDGHGTGVEVYPAGSVMLPNGEAGAIFARTPANDVQRSPTHMALSVEKDAHEVAALAAAKGWDCFTCDRGGHFHVMEVWVENAQLIEILPPAFAAEYLAFTQHIATMTDPNSALAGHAPQAETLRAA